MLDMISLYVLYNVFIHLTLIETLNVNILLIVKFYF